MATNDSEKKGMSFMDKLVNFLRKSLPIVGVIVVGILSGIFGYKLGVKSSGSTDDSKEPDNSTPDVDEQQPRPQYQQSRNQQPRQNNGFQPNRGNNGGGSPFAQNGGMRNNGNNDQLL